MVKENFKCIFDQKSLSTKIAYLLGSKSWGGLELNQLKNAIWMNKRGHDVFIVCWKDSPIYVNAINSQINIITIEEYGKYYEFKKGKKLANLLKTERVTHLFVRSNHDLSIAATVKRHLKSKISISYFMEMQFGISKKSIFHNIRYAYFDFWICPLHWLKNQVKTLTNVSKQKIHVVPSGIDLSLFKSDQDSIQIREQLGLNKDAFVFGLFGRIDKNKNQLLVLEALNLLKEENIQILFLGDLTFNESIEYFNRFQDYIIDNELENKVKKFSFTNEISKYYQAIDCLINATDSETVGMTTIEALAMKKYVLGANAGGSKEILDNAKIGLLFEPGNHIDLAEKMKLIFTKQINIDDSLMVEKALEFDHHKVCLMIENLVNLDSNSIKSKNTRS